MAKQSDADNRATFSLHSWRHLGCVMDYALVRFKVLLQCGGSAPAKAW